MTTETNIHSETNLPTFIAYYAVEKGDKSYWNQIGACFDHRDGKGKTLRIHSLPICFDGTIVLREPKAE